jgi:myo-inositol 2-dehydrogenase/D-chiro-inositol 1-dehydrogenase
VELVAVADPVRTKAERLASRHHVQAMRSLEQLLDLGLDVVSVCTPSPTHRSLVEQALAAGVHVLCEKPIARTLEDAGAIISAARTAAGMLMVGHVSRFEPEHRRAQQLVAAGRIGELRMMSQTITGTMPGWSESDWLADPAQSGGPVVDLAIHSFDYLAWINQSQPVRVHAMGRDTDAGPATYALITLRYANGAIGVVETSWAHPASHGFKLATELMGSDGRITWNYDDLIGGVLCTAEGQNRWDPLGNRGFRAQMAAFVEAIRAGGPAPIGADEGAAALRTSLAALESIRTGRTVQLTADIGTSTR